MRWPDRTTWERFMAKVVATDGCWFWRGATHHNGYGAFRTDRTVRAHRFAYERLRGPIPAGLELDHLCRNRACVNPEHLEPVTGRENVLRGVAGSAQNARKTHCHRGHEFTPENTHIYLWRGTARRRCRACYPIDNALKRTKIAITPRKEAE